MFIGASKHHYCTSIFNSCVGHRGNLTASTPTSRAQVEPLPLNQRICVIRASGQNNNLPRVITSRLNDERVETRTEGIHVLSSGVQRDCKNHLLTESPLYELHHQGKPNLSVRCYPHYIRRTEQVGSGLSCRNQGILQYVFKSKKWVIY